VLGRGYLRITTAVPDDNQRFIAALGAILGRGEAPSVEAGAGERLTSR